MAGVHRTQAVRHDLDLGSSSSASAHFESRPSQRSELGSPEICFIMITANMGPQNIPYPVTRAPKGRTSASYRQLIRTTFLKHTPIWINADKIDVQWATSIKYLLPNHVTGANNDVADRKLWAETVEGMLKLGLN
jgi:hypothetical protein